MFRGFFSPLFSRPFGGDGVAALTYIMRDLFSTPDAAPVASPRACEPGPGTIDITDTNGVGYISGGEYYFPGGGGAFDPALHRSTSYPRATGLAFSAVINTTGSTPVTFDAWEVGLDNTQPISGAATDSIRGLDGSRITLTANATSVQLGESWAANQLYTMCLVCRSAGTFYLIKGGSFTNWTLIYVGATGTDAVIPSVAAIIAQAVFRLDQWLFMQMSTPWDDDYGIFTARNATPSANDTITGVADGIAEFTWIPGAGETLDFMIRRTDDNNCWIVRGNEAGGTVKLIERNAGVETERSSAAQTWTVGVAVRIVATHNGNAIRTFVNNVAKNSYLFASFNNSATGLKTSHAGTNLIAWPRSIGGAAQIELDRWIP